MQRIGNLLEPKSRADRERRPVPGLDGTYEITRTGMLWSVAGQDWVEPPKWPYAPVIHNEQLAEINVVDATALAWLTPDQRSALRQQFPSPIPYGQDYPPALLEKEQELRVSARALAQVTSTKTDGDFSHWGRLKPLDTANECAWIRKASVEEYQWTLVEQHRPPSKGGNTHALHRHRILIGGKWYSFFAVGTKKWVWEGDLVTFRYTITAEGYRNVAKETLLTFSKKGETVVRGDRSFKPNLRTAPARLPASRREQR